MTKEQYDSCFYTGTHLILPYCEFVEAYALGLLAHKDTARRVRDSVYEQGFELAADLEVTASAELWSLLRRLTRETCLNILNLPEAKNPLTRSDSAAGGPVVPTTHLEVFYQLLSEVPFKYKRALLLTYLFEESPQQISKILNQTVEEVHELIARGNIELGTAFLRVPMG